MTSFLANEPIPETPAAVTNDGWFPDIDLTKMRESSRLDGTVTEVRLTDALIAAILHVNDQLKDWQATQAAQGHAVLGEVPAPQIAGESRLVALYRRAVYCHAKAGLIESYRDYDTTGEGNKKADLLDPNIDEQRRSAHWAVSDILGRPRVTVELI